MIWWTESRVVHGIRRRGYLVGKAPAHAHMEAYWQEVLDAKRNRPHRRRVKSKVAAKPKPRRNNAARRKSKNSRFVRRYYAYLKSPEWAERVRQAHAFYSGACTICGGTSRLHVHHRHYKTTFRETMEDLDLLCDGCHQNSHEEDGKAMDPLTREFLAIVRQ
jgi:5-methylcytosine-specific restriction endonuclease McrA